jgi:hypothetical protein
LNVHEVNIRQTEIHTFEPLVPEPSSFESESDSEKLKRFKLPDIDHILAELIQGVGNTLHYGIHKLACFIQNKVEVPQQWKESVIVPGDRTDYYRGI